MNLKNTQQGVILIQVLVFGVIAFLFVGGLMAWAGSNVRFARNLYNRETASNIAEAGIEYYRWHLAHDPNDFQDGTGLPGPYVHPYYDAAGNRIGEFSLEITPPEEGSNVLTITSTGTVDNTRGSERTIEAVLGQPSLAEYAVIGNTDLYFAENVTVTGQIHANGGIRFDGTANDLVTSALSTYTDPSHSGNQEFAVHTHVSPVDPEPPASVPDRSDVFIGGRSFPAPAFDFDGITEDLAALKSGAQTDGLYLPNSGVLGYHLTFHNDDRVTINKVTGITAPPLNCTDTLSQSDWGSWSIETEIFDQITDLPDSGAIFVEDDLWLDGQIATARITVGAARFPENPTTYANITINDDLLYTNYNGQDIIGIIAQNNINIGMDSADDLRIDAALVAKNGRLGRYYYNSTYCSPYDTKNSLTLFGLIASNGLYGMRYSDGNGYQNRVITYDGNLLYYLPPYFPATAAAYKILTWREL